MQKRTNIILVMAVLVAMGTMLAVKVVQARDESVPPPMDTKALTANEVKGLLLLMDTDKSGKISKQEFMDFMAAEFDRLDKDKSGELDPQELMHSHLRPARFSDVGK